MRPLMIAFAALLLPPLLMAPAFAGTPRVEALLARHLEARGGLARIRALRSLVSTGRVEVGGLTLDLRVENPRGAFRSETRLGALTKIEAWDGRTGWVDDPFSGTPGPRPMTPAQLRQAALQADFDGPLVDAEAKGYRIAYKGTTLLAGGEAHVLEVDLGNGDTLTSCLDARTFLEVKATNRAVRAGKVVEVETVLGDYRPVAGVLLPFALDIRVKGEAEALKIRFDRVEGDLRLDPARFSSPAAILPSR
ncbi:MAG: hypothetical protein U0P81_05265 [Holophagaceae bacterium]